MEKVYSQKGNSICHSIKIPTFYCSVFPSIVEPSVLIANIIMFGQGTVQKVLSEYTDEESDQDARVNQLEAFLEAKTNEISKLHRCFSEATHALLDYQRRQEILKRSLAQVLAQCSILRDDSRLILQYVEQFKRWKRFEEDKIRQLPQVISEIMKQNKEILLERFKDQIESVSRRYQFELFRIQQAQKTQIDILKAQFENKLQLSKETIFVLEAEVGRLKTFEASSVNLMSEDSICKSTPLKPKNNFNIVELCSKLESKYQLQSKGENTPLNGQRKVFNPTPKSSNGIKRSLEKPVNNQNIRQQNIQLNARSQSKAKHQHSGHFTTSVLPSLSDLVASYQNTHDCRTNGFSTLSVSGKEVYRGLWKSGRFHGRGKLTTENWIYDGEFRNGTADGLGNLYFGKSSFIGRFVNSDAEGEGTLTTPDGQTSGIWSKNHLVQLL